MKADEAKGNDEGAPAKADTTVAPRGTAVMAVVRWLLVAAMAVAAVIAFTKLSDEEQAQDAATTLYTCPMHPAIVQDHPGQCPICGMTLVPKKNTGAAAGPTEPVASHTGAAPAGLVPITLTPERIQLTGMRTAKATRAPLGSELRATGYVAARESAMAQVHARFSGFIESLPVAATGQRVARGQLLATIYSQQLLAAQQDLLNAAKWSQGATASAGTAPGLSGATLLAGARTRLEQLGVASEEIEEVVRSGHVKNALGVRSPIAGYVSRKSAVLGAYVEPGSELFEIADLSSVWVLIDVPEQQIAAVRKGARARFSLPALEGQIYSGPVELVYPTLDSETRTLRLRLVLKNPNLALRPGMYGDAVVEVRASAGLVVPTEAIVDTGATQYVFVALEGGRFEPRKVKLGARVADRVEVLEGVRDGETVVTTANFLLDSESRLAGTIAGAPEEQEPPLQAESQHTKGTGASTGPPHKSSARAAAISKPWR
ncbi:MAG: efflux RND transporter periplasmic adaptor subunit [Polyangiales bacterium]